MTAAPHPQLSLDAAEIDRAGSLLTQMLQRYEAQLESLPVLPSLDREALAALRDQPFPAEGIGVERLFGEIARVVIPNSTAIAHPRFLAYVQGPPNGIAPFAEAIASMLNQNCNFWQLSPAASVIERKVVDWLAALFGFGSEAGGLITSGGSMATLMALSAALHAKSPRDFRRRGLQGQGRALTVYVSEEAHRCVEKAAAVLGLGLDHVRRIPVDAAFRLRMDALQSAVEADRAAGHHPVCVVGTAGTVNTGAIDPIDALADFCAVQDLWLHVDGAFGALFVQSGRVMPIMAACARADSLALDPHKLLFAPLEAGCLVVRDPDTLKKAFSFSASYLGAQDDPLFTNYMEHGLQLSRGFKAFKLWCALQALGTRAFAQAADRMLQLAQYMAGRIDADPRFERLAPVTLSAVCFRLCSADEAGNAAALQALADSGQALLGPVRLQGRFGLRACFTNFRTRESDVDQVLEVLGRWRAA
jgi:aromatic-L-amino-acid decarboxylase